MQAPPPWQEGAVVASMKMKQSSWRRTLLWMTGVMLVTMSRLGRCGHFPAHDALCSAAIFFVRLYL